VTLTCARRPWATPVSTRRPATCDPGLRPPSTRNPDLRPPPKGHPGLHPPSTCDPGLQRGGERRAVSAARFHDLAATHLQATPRYSGDSDTYGKLTAVFITTLPALLATSQLRVTLALAAIPRSDRLTPKALPVTLTVRRRTCRAKGLPATLPVPKAKQVPATC
jgi:hypothetical protein